MKQHVIYVFTHDSIGLGEDGPTHQPIEQLSTLRAIPNLVVLRPADAGETAAAWRVAVEHEGGPVALVLTRQKLGYIDRDAASGFAPAAELARGGYVLRESKGTPKVVLAGSGSEVGLLIAAGDILAREGLATRIVSMPSMELFERQPDAYRDSVLPEGVPRVVVEAGHPMSWQKWVNRGDRILGVSRFGASAPYERLYEELGLTVDAIVAAARDAGRGSR
jgi:transketolase